MFWVVLFLKQWYCSLVLFTTILTLYWTEHYLSHTVFDLIHDHYDSVCAKNIQSLMRGTNLCRFGVFNLDLHLKYILFYFLPVWHWNNEHCCFFITLCHTLQRASFHIFYVIPKQSTFFSAGFFLSCFLALELISSCWLNQRCRYSCDWLQHRQNSEHAG